MIDFPVCVRDGRFQSWLRFVVGTIVRFDDIGLYQSFFCLLYARFGYPVLVALGGFDG